MSVHDWLTIAQTLGLPVVLLLTALYTGHRQVWAWGYQLQEAEDRAEKWERLALRGTGLAERGADTAATLIEIAKELQSHDPKT